MMLFRLLCLCLLALVLVPVAPLQAHAVQAEAGSAMAAVPRDPAGAGHERCHERSDVAAATGSGHGNTTRHDAGCCDGDDSSHSCGSACACATNASALPPPVVAATPVVHRRHWTVPATSGRSGHGSSPPRRPPIG